jgi:hypothetical protein
MNIAELHEEIRMVIPNVVLCLKDPNSWVRELTIGGLLSIAKHGALPYVPLGCNESRS